MKPLYTSPALAFACAGILNVNAAAATKPAEPSTASRTVEYHDADIVTLNNQIRFTTLIQLPR